MATNVTADQLVEKYQGDAVPTLPDYTKLTSEGFPTDGNPSTGLVATLPGAAWFALVSAMRISLIKAAGLQPASVPDPLQWLTALQSLSWMLDGKILSKYIADGAITTEKINNAAVTYAKLASALIATEAQAKAGTDNTVLLTPLRAMQLITGNNLSVPSGVIVPYGGKVVPAGWLKCDGSLVNRQSYASLFGAISTNWGAGDGSTTFQLPNVNGRVLQGTSNAAEVGNYLEASLPNITGQFGSIRAWTLEPAVSGVHAISWRDDNVIPTSTGTGNTAYSVSTNANRSSSLYSGSSLQVPAAQVLMIIKV